MKPFKIKYIDIACFFAILFPIMPSYFEIGGISIINILCVFVILLGLLGGVTRNIGCVSTDKIIICVWVLWETIICFFHGSIIGAVVNLLYIIAVIFVAKSINTFEKIDKIIDCIIYVAGIISIFGLIESLTGFNVFSLLNTSGLSLNYNPPRFGLTRIISSSGHAIEYCLYCMMCMTLKANKLLSKENFETEKIGLAMVLGNYINTLFVSADKQFVKWFFGNQEFAYYSFGMSMQSLMTVFIISIAQPLFPAMAQGKFKDEEYNSIKELLIVFGSLSGCAYFAVSIIVKLFIQKYTSSLDIVGIYFVVFPAMAVINCLYINLYKIKGIMKTYIKTLFGILLLSIILNTIFVFAVGEFTGVAIATTITYYIWFLIGFKQFEFLRITVKDVTYLIAYTIGFFVITKAFNDYLGFFVYFAFIAVLVMGCYKKEIMAYVKKILKK